VGGRCPFHDLSAGETAAPDLSGECGGGKTPPQISRRKDQAGSLGNEEKASRTRDIHSKAYNPGLTSGVLCRFFIGSAPVKYASHFTGQAFHGAEDGEKK
jgi:hypothetical protein